MTSSRTSSSTLQARVVYFWVSSLLVRAYEQLCRDTTPMVRRAAASNLKVTTLPYPYAPPNLTSCVFAAAHLFGPGHAEVLFCQSCL